MTPNFFAPLRDAYEARRDPEGMRMLARMYWRMLIMLLAVMVIGGFYFGVQELFTTLATLSGSPADAGKPQSALDRSRLEATLQSFSSKAASYQQGVGLAASTTDPSR